MKILYDYKCPKCGVFEAYATREDIFLPEGCPQCGETTKRMPIVLAVFTNSAGNQVSGKALRD